MENVIEIKNLVKKYKDVLAVDDLSIKVKKGELYAFLGVNGAGKSTTISVICGSLEKTSGSVTVLGENVDTDIDKIVAKTGVVFQNSALDKVLTVKENLAYKAAMYGLNKTRTDEKIEELASLLDFKDYLNRPFGKRRYEAVAIHLRQKRCVQNKQNYRRDKRGEEHPLIFKKHFNITLY